MSLGSPVKMSSPLLILSSVALLFSLLKQVSSKFEVQEDAFVLNGEKVRLVGCECAP